VNTSYVNKSCEISRDNFVCFAGALGALQEATEAFSTLDFHAASLFAAHDKRVTIMKRDLTLLSQVKNLFNII